MSETLRSLAWQGRSSEVICHCLIPSFITWDLIWFLFCKKDNVPWHSTAQCFTARLSWDKLACWFWCINPWIAWPIVLKDCCLCAMLCGRTAVFSSGTYAEDLGKWCFQAVGTWTALQCLPGSSFFCINHPRSIVYFVCESQHVQQVSKRYRNWKNLQITGSLPVFYFSLLFKVYIWAPCIRWTCVTALGLGELCGIGAECPYGCKNGSWFNKSIVTSFDICFVLF